MVKDFGEIVRFTFNVDRTEIGSKEMQIEGWSKEIASSFREGPRKRCSLGQRFPHGKKKVPLS